MKQAKLADSFWSKVKKGEGCWMWEGANSSHGYGSMTFQQKRYRAHRVAWFLRHGEWPGPYHVLHSCDTPACVNPDHLHLGTHADNMREASARGLMDIGDSHWTRRRPELIKRGADHHSSKLTEEQVLAIRAAEHPHTVGRKMGLSKGSIADIVHRRTWKHI